MANSYSIDYAKTTVKQIFFFISEGREGGKKSFDIIKIKVQNFMFLNFRSLVFGYNVKDVPVIYKKMNGSILKS